MMLMTMFLCGLVTSVSAGDVLTRAAVYPHPEHVVNQLHSDGSTMLQKQRLFGQKAPDRLEAVLLMCDFSDSLMFGRHGELPGEFPAPAQTEFLYSAHDSIYFVHLLDDISRYFEAASGGRFDLNVTVVGEVANLPHPMAWYGNHPDEGEQKIQLVADVVAATDHLVDFGLYDTVMVIHAGAGEETDVLGNSPEQIYSSYLSPEDFLAAVEDEILVDPWLETDEGVAGRIQHVLVLPETEYQDSAGGLGGYFGSMGVYCFEVGLRLGMLSLSDFTPSGNPDSQGIGQFGLMGYGLFAAGGLIPTEPCAFNKMLMGWLEPYDIDPDVGGTFSLFPAEHAGADSTLARIAIGPSEYWLVEYRLQDPDGNRIFSFGDDRNGNGVPDFTRIDDETFSPWSDEGVVLATFDPELHIKEVLSAGEWDFFMSDNLARAPGVKGAGSGLYIWHVDEGVISRALDAESNVFNADPQRKSIDLEEADGLQDLDSRRPSPWMLGGDDDSFRGEDHDLFGPETHPSTATAGGAWTGIVIDAVSEVVVDSAVVVPEVPWPVLIYADSMTFRCRKEAPETGRPLESASLDLPGIDLRGSHLLAVDLDSPPDGTLEIVAVDVDGRVFAWHHDLSPMLEGGEALGHLTTGTDALGDAVTWTGAPAAADVDDDGSVEIIVNGPGGTYMFHADGSEVRDGDFDPDSHGLAAPVSGTITRRVGTPAILAASFADEPVAGPRLVATLNEDHQDTDTISSFFYELYDAAGDRVVSVPGMNRAFPGMGDLPGPVTWDGHLISIGYDGQGGYVSSPGALTGEGLLTEFSGRPSPWPPLALDDGLLVPMSDGGCLHVGRDGARVWDNGFPVRSPMAPGVVYASDDAFVKSGRFGAPETSWPAIPVNDVRTAAARAAVSPLAWRVADKEMTVFAAPDGRLYLVDERGDVVPGWPLAGPGETAATPLVMDLDGSPGLELVAVGTMPRLLEHDPGENAVTELVSRLVVWELPGTDQADVIWPMWGGTPERTNQAPEQSPIPGGQALVEEGSVSLYPTPASGDRLYARVRLNHGGTLSAILYNLEGEEVARSEIVTAVAGEPAEAVLDVGGAVSGTYFCKMIVQGGGERSVIVKPAAIER